MRPILRVRFTRNANFQFSSLVAPINRYLKALLCLQGRRFEKNMGARISERSEPLGGLGA